ncbi:hypothetical protein OIU76_017211 [Salix suchowensis]|uniref:F-box domain-containing protein n=1 Tax=Salix suchowensis TaxID=1278906 RepID=A0ABQ9BZZ4_9ROSI|nr:hypothetical protein OIU76_017211 [Salix suchowensis]KAJ6392841.1 hypothetical protein OIU77_022343 [Salix suchowensis]
MKRFKATQQSQNQDFALRRSARLADKFMNLPDELTTKIFSKMEDDPKTLIRCSLVSKKWASFVSKTVSLTLRFSRNGRFLACSIHHYHIPLSALPAIMKVFANLESLEIKVCHPASEQPVYGNITKMTVTWEGYVSQTDTWVAFEVGTLSTIGGAMLSHDFDEKKIATIKSSLVTDFYWIMIAHRPEKLKTLVIYSAKNYGVLSGKVLITIEQVSNLHDSISNSRVSESWLEDPQNIVYWHKNNSDKEQLIHDQVWLVYRSNFFVTKNGLHHEIIVREKNAKELLDGLDDHDHDIDIEAVALLGRFGASHFRGRYDHGRNLTMGKIKNGRSFESPFGFYRVRKL